MRRPNDKNYNRNYTLKKAKIYLKKLFLIEFSKVIKYLNEV